MASTLVVTSSVAGVSQSMAPQFPGQTVKISLAWTSDASAGTISNTFGPVMGFITAAEFVPGAGGTQPSDAYDLTITDAAGVDQLGGAGANLSNSVATKVPVFITDGSNKIPNIVSEGATGLTLVGANCGNSKTGTVNLFLRC